MNQAAPNPTPHSCPLCGQAALLDGVKLVPDYRALAIDGAMIQFTGKEFAVVERLHRSFGRAVSKDSLMMAMYPNPDEEPEGNSDFVSIILHKVRRKLAWSRVAIANVWGFGALMKLKRGKRQ